MSGFIDQVEVDLIVNGQPRGELATDVTGRYTLDQQVGFDPGLMRPVIQSDGKKYLRIRTGRMVKNKPSHHDYVTNKADGEDVPETQHIPLERMIANGTVPQMLNNSALPFRTWALIDRAVIKASRDRLNAWNDLAAANTFSGFDGMAMTGLIRDTMTDPGEAMVTMDAMADDFNDAPLYTPDILPLPIIHAGASVTQRRLAQLRNSGQPFETTAIEAAGRRCSEMLEQMTIGATSFTSLLIGQSDVPAYTNQGIYGFRTHPDRITFATVTAIGAFTPAAFLTDVLAMIELARAQRFYGPFVLYYSPDWNQYLARDYVVGTLAQGYTTVNQTVRERIQRIDEIQRVAMLDYFTNANELLLVQMTSETVRAVVGMEFTPVQWTQDGGAVSMIRVLGIKVPDLRSQYVGQSVVATARQCGVVHGTTP